MLEDVPDTFFKSLAQDIDYPLACVNIENKFVWVNNAFERLVGYSIAELINTSWIDITKQQDVGADLAGVNSVISGKIDEYSMEKKYVHKRGHDVDVELTVRRWPKSHLDQLLFFRVEACPAKATRPELQEVHDELLGIIKELQRKVDLQTSEKGGVKIDFNNGGNNIGGDSVGRDKIQNNDQMIKYMIGAIISLGLVISWLAYYVATMSNGSVPVPPN